ncbi:helix-turn-helix domain-containing protein [Ursidibacter maritimus]|uniref:RodZ domain-containing protein n=1 Tax=Ursidibacter maritimus TaxID=1331689 RepID=UPI001C46D65E|nr:RodZ domain-containing protein [Ursidibacter maritimus]MBV6541108.1 helix-turn-helix domain-containing protein [Ursidibacter maritimus]
MTETTDMLSLGQQLKNAREALDLSIEDIASKTNLKKNHIEALENDIFILQNVPPTFVRGYVRNYVRFLRLPEELVNSVNYGEVTIPNEVKRPVSNIPVHNQKSQLRWVKTLTWLILLCAVGMTLAWWWQEHQKEKMSSDELVSNNISVMQAAPTTETPSVATASPTVEVQSEPSSSSVTIQPVEATPTETTATTDDTTKTVTSSENNAAPIENTQVPVNILQQNVSEQGAVVEPVKTEETAAEQTQSIGNDELRIEITNAQSWITVRDGKRKRLAEKLYNSGEVLTFNGNEQYSLTVGAPGNVKIYYKGQEVPLKVDGRVARFKLPLAK